jgi:hypothetical protein
VQRARTHLQRHGLGGLAVTRVHAIPMDRRHHSKIDRAALADLLARTPSESDGVEEMRLAA